MGKNLGLFHYLIKKANPHLKRVLELIEESKQICEDLRNGSKI